MHMAHRCTQDAGGAPNMLRAFQMVVGLAVVLVLICVVCRISRTDCEMLRLPADSSTMKRSSGFSYTIIFGNELIWSSPALVREWIGNTSPAGVWTGDAVRHGNKAAEETRSVVRPHPCQSRSACVVSRPPGQNTGRPPTLRPGVGATACGGLNRVTARCARAAWPAYYGQVGLVLMSCMFCSAMPPKGPRQCWHRWRRAGPGPARRGGSTANSPQQCARPDPTGAMLCANQAPHTLQHHIALGMAVLVVDGLEMVQIGMNSTANGERRRRGQARTIAALVVWQWPLSSPVSTSVTPWHGGAP